MVPFPLWRGKRFRGSLALGRSLSSLVSSLAVLHSSLAKVGDLAKSFLDCFPTDGALEIGGSVGSMSVWQVRCELQGLLAMSILVDLQCNLYHLENTVA